MSTTQVVQRIALPSSFTGGRIKCRSWTEFSWEVETPNWRPIAHYFERRYFHGIHEAAVQGVLQHADLRRKSHSGRFLLRLSGRKLRKIHHKERGAAWLKDLDRLIVVVGFEGDVITAWLERKPRSLRRRRIYAITERKGYEIRI